MSTLIFQRNFPSYRHKLFHFCITSTKISLPIFFIGFSSVISCDDLLFQQSMPANVVLLGQKGTKKFLCSLYKVVIMIIQSKVVFVPNKMFNPLIFLSPFLRLFNKNVFVFGHLYARNRGFTINFARILWLQFFTRILVYTRSEASVLAGLFCSKTSNFIHYLNNSIPIQPALSPDDTQNILTDNSFNLMFIGRNTDKTNIDLLAEAFSLLSRFDICLPTINLYCTLSQQEIDSIFSDYCNISINPIVNPYDQNSLHSYASLCNFSIYPGDIGLSLVHYFAYSLPAIIHSSYSCHYPESAISIPGANTVNFLRNNPQSLAESIVYASKLSLDEYNGMRSFSYLTYKSNDFYSACINLESFLSV